MNFLSNFMGITGPIVGDLTGPIVRGITNAPGADTFTVLNSAGTAFVCSRIVKNSAGTDFTVLGAVLDSDGNSFSPI